MRPADVAAAEARVAEPEAELAEERLRRDALGELVRDPKAGDPASPSNSQEAGLGERLRRGFGHRLADVPALLGISKSPCEYAGRANERAEARRAEVAGRVRHAFEASRRRCGYRRVGASVLSGADGLPTAEASERGVRRAMREGGMPSWKGLCEEGRVARSMSRKGCCPGNARMEGFFGALKEEFCNGRDWSRTPPGGVHRRAGRVHPPVPRRAPRALRGAGRLEGARYDNGPQEAARLRRVAGPAPLPQPQPELLTNPHRKTHLTGGGYQTHPRALTW